MARALLVNGPVNNPRDQIHTRQQWKMHLSGGMLFGVARQERANEDAGKGSREFFSVWSYATIELGILFVVRVEAVQRE
jgi:hypothetical protein